MSSKSTVTALVVLSVLVAPATLVAIPTEATGAATTIDSCRVIDEPGQYTLTQDVVREDEETDRDSCFDIRADDVVLDGGGHVVNAGGSGYQIAGVNIQGDNVTVTNVTVRDAGIGIRFEEANGSTAEHNDVEEVYTGFQFEDANGSTVAHNDVEEVYVGVRLEKGSGNTIANNTVHRSQISLLVSGENNTVVDNLETTPDGGRMMIAGANNTIANNTVGTSSFALQVEGQNHTIVRNDLAGGEGVSLSGGTIRLRGKGHEVAHNELVGITGVLVESATGPISIHDNRIDTVYAIKILDPSVCAFGPEGAEAVAIRNNTFETGDSYVPRVGVLNKDNETVNATNNYWGAPDGPSSIDDKNVSDPVTGTLANGSGVQVSEGVNFDPWRSEPVNETAT